MRATVHVTAASGAATASNWVVVDNHGSPALTLALEVDGTAVCTAEYTLTDVGLDGPGGAVTFTVSGLDGVSGNAAAGTDLPLGAVRVNMSSGASGAVASLTVLQHLDAR